MNPSSSSAKIDLHYLLPAAWLPLLWTLSFPAVGRVMEPGLDSSYRLAFNYFFAEGIAVGSDVLLTLGPLGFLLFPHDMGHNLVTALVFWGVLQLFFVGLWGFILLRLGRESSIWIKLWSCLAVFLLIRLTQRGDLLIFCNLLLLLLYEETGKKYFGFSAGLIVALSLMIKPGYGVVCLLTLLSAGPVSACMARSWQGLRRYLAPLVAAGVCFVVLWLLLNGGPGGIGTYLLATKHFSSGYSSAMSLEADTRWIWLFAGGLVMAVGTYFSRDRRLTFTVLTFALPLLVWFKYAISRADHVLLFFDVLLILLLFLMARANRWKTIGITTLTACLVAGACQRAFSHYPWPHVRDFSPFSKVGSAWNLDGWRNLNRTVFHFGEYRSRLGTLSRERLAPQTLAPNLRSRIGDAPVDVYPWEISFLIQNDLHWRPRPVFQSYTAYTPWLDERNRNFFASQDAPEFILWHARDLLGIDGRYLLNDEPRTLYQIMRHYRLELENPEGPQLLKRSPRPMFCEWVNRGRVTAGWQTWLAVPDHESGILRARTTFQRGAWGHMLKLLYKEGPVFIEYETRDGQVRKHRLVIDNAPAGLWAGPYVRTLKRVREPRAAPFDESAANEEVHLFVDRFSTEKDVFDLLGWALLPARAATNSRISVWFAGDRNQGWFEVVPERLQRADVAAHYPDLPMENCGFHLVLPLERLPPDRYQVGVMVQHPGDSGFRWLDRTLAVPVAEPAAIRPWESIPVSRIRFSHEGPGGFGDRIEIIWETSDVRP